MGTNPGGEGGPSTLLNPEEIGPVLTSLGVCTFDLPFRTHDGRFGSGGNVTCVDPEHIHIFLTAGVHACERGGPDALVQFITDLLEAQRRGIGLEYGAKTFSRADVVRVLGAGIVFVPMVNPDGIHWDQRTNTIWRKNRNPVSGDPANPNDPAWGVDINRNFDFLWDSRHFDPSAAPNIVITDPKEPRFHGTAPFSEPETRNVAWIFDTFPRIRWYMDIHSFAQTILYNWGDDDNQSSDQMMAFWNPAYDGRRGKHGIADYKEWIVESDEANLRGVARRVSGAMETVAGHQYPTQQHVYFNVGVSGTGRDYALNRHYRPGSQRNKVYGYTMEFGSSHFYPASIAEFRSNIREVCAGLMEFCLAAADIGLT
ncbi:M14 family zinc carboxypeptidase [Nannocystis radixulma]|uniref:M14 family zinc carboxypeptidase n=1 Tax=Nannocystis radixulma TaxID=2995305 RepID=A0ABT5BE49_9BACT|nr:M14 family zinc carboxypeptidase [Nannocystis radixulma]MDC0672425.1 M14 family zinc carboxypeptidase [Nannocystis radixulma]